MKFNEKVIIVCYDMVLAIYFVICITSIYLSFRLIILEMNNGVSVLRNPKINEIHDEYG